jgi:hypothetical protein
LILLVATFIAQNIDISFHINMLHYFAIGTSVLKVLHLDDFAFPFFVSAVNRLFKSAIYNRFVARVKHHQFALHL